MLQSAPDGTPGGVLWDLDGTLVDSGELHYEAWQAVLAGRGRAFDRAAFAASFGKRNDLILRELFEGTLASEEAARLGDEKEALYRDLVRRRGLPLLPGAREW